MTASSLLNYLSFIAGTVLYITLLTMVVGSAVAERHVNRLALLAAGLGFVWNIGTFAAYFAQSQGHVPIPLLTAFSYSAFSILPALAFHASVRIEGTPLTRSASVAVFSAYVLSGIACLLHFVAALHFNPVPSAQALRAVAAGGILLTGPLLLLSRHRQEWNRTLCLAALGMFAVSALHMSEHHSGDPWWLELVGHDASLPLVLAILYQDFRFALADIFLKRAVALICLVSLIFAACCAESYLIGGWGNDSSQFWLPLLSVGTALSYPWLRRFSDWFVDVVILQRIDYERLLSNAAAILGSLESVEDILDQTGRILEPVLMGRSYSWCKEETAEPRTMNAASVRIRIPVAEPPYYSFSISAWAAGRRLLSDEWSMLEKLAGVAGRRIDLVRTSHERCVRDLREEEMRKLTAEAELRALRAQIHPHFLFNSLTTIGYLIQSSPDRAVGTLTRLCSLLRMALRTTDEFVSLGAELSFIELYLEIERARFEERLRVQVLVPQELRDIRIPTLLIQPLVENALKHGVAKSSRGGEIRIAARLGEARTVTISIADTGAGASEDEIRCGRENGLGLANVERRLACLDDPLARLSIASTPEIGTIVEVRLTARWTAHTESTFVSHARRQKSYIGEEHV